MGKIEKEVTDKGGRRQGIDRRQVDIDVEKNRREKEARRSGTDRRDNYSYKNDKSERRESFRIK